VPFFNVDDQFHGHPKRRKAGWAAVGLWTTAGSWCRAYKRDGFVPADLIDEWKAKRYADQLVAAGLWFLTSEGDESGYQFHDWLDINSTSDEVEKQREAARERQRNRRKKLEELRNGV
jgi:hypothetical protein